MVGERNQTEEIGWRHQNQGGLETGLERGAEPQRHFFAPRLGDSVSPSPLDGPTFPHCVWNNSHFPECGCLSLQPSAITSQLALLLQPATSSFCLSLALPSTREHGAGPLLPQGLPLLCLNSRSFYREAPVPCQTMSRPQI